MLKPCRVCGKATLFCYCEEHRKEAAAKRKQRQLEMSDYEREAQAFYQSTLWRNLRMWHLQNNPLCVSCSSPATLVDHKTPIRRGGERTEPKNLQSMCAKCHDEKRATEGSQYSYEPKFSGKFKCPTTLVWGPPGGGKSYYVKQNALADDLIFDLDEFVMALSNQPKYSNPWPLTAAALAARDAILSYLCNDATAEKIRHAWLITSAATKAGRVSYLEAGATEVPLVPARYVCLDRIAQEPERAARYEQWQNVIVRWYADYEADAEKVTSANSLL